MSQKLGSRPMTGRDFGLGIMLMIVAFLVGAALWLSGSFEWLFEQLPTAIAFVRDLF